MRLGKELLNRRGVALHGSEWQNSARILRWEKRLRNRFGAVHQCVQGVNVICARIRRRQQAVTLAWRDDADYLRHPYPLSFFLFTLCIHPCYVPLPCLSSRHLPIHPVGCTPLLGGFVRRSFFSWYVLYSRAVTAGILYGRLSIGLVKDVVLFCLTLDYRRVVQCRHEAILISICLRRRHTGAQYSMLYFPPRQRLLFEMQRREHVVQKRRAAERTDRRSGKET